MHGGIVERVRGWKMVWSPRGGCGARGDLLDRVLAVRGVADGQSFLDPSLLNLHDPSLLPGADRAAERLLGAARAGEPIVVYGDYDVDGITATAILFRMLRALVPGAVVGTYVPHRLEEGYGLNAAAMGDLAARGARVVVSVDCGITAAEPARAAREAGLDLIISDHHNPPGDGAALPEAYAVVHPRLAGSRYPYGELCGAGVAYKLAWRLATMAEGSDRVSPPIRTLLLDLLALAALGTVADVVPLLDENRVITRFGLSRCKTTAITGLVALIDAAGLGGEKIDAESVGFRLGPMLNASGRMGHAAEAVELFTTEDRTRADEIAAGLCVLNEQRRSTERRIFEQAAEMAEAGGMTGDDRRAIVLAHDEWHPGVVGIVCSRLVERYARPAILMQRQEGGVCAGSGRSIDGFNLHDAVHSCSGCLIGFGGHDMAIGLRLETARLEEFRERFIARANEGLAVDDLVRTARFDTEASLGELTPATVKRLERLAPFGRSNPAVRLLVRGLRVDGRAEPFGKTGDHLRVRLRDNSGASTRAIGWKWAEMLESFRPGSLVDVLIEPKVSGWSGAVEPVLVDARGAGVAAGVA
jgi:single-stranded-DNA-specific exonuclease